MNPLFPQLLPFSDAALLCLRLLVAAVFFTSVVGLGAIQKKVFSTPWLDQGCVLKP